MTLAGVLTKKNSSLGYKTGTWKTVMPIVDFAKCIHCMLCVANCPENTIKAKPDKEKVALLDRIDLSYCKGCSICANVCPVKCIKMVEAKHG